MEDIVRMWSIVGGNLPGIGLTTPTFSDGWVDYQPWKIGPAFSRGVKEVCLNRSDLSHNNNYTGFSYDPLVFLSLDREWDQDTQISTCTTCKDHARQQEVGMRGTNRFCSKGVNSFDRCSLVPKADRLRHNTMIMSKIISQ